MKKAANLYQDHGTKILGALGAVVPSLMAIDGMVTADNMKYWLAANAVVGALTVKRGFTNSKRK